MAVSYAEGVKLLDIDGVTPSVATVANGTYPVSRKLYQYTINKPTGAARDFMLYELSKEGQALAIKAGYVPLPEAMRKASIAQVK